MKYISMPLAALLVVASLAVSPLYADEGGDGSDEYGEPPAVENGAIILAEEGGGGDEYSEPPTMENEIVILADEGGGDGVHGEPSPEEARDTALV
jgi:hypothetical protein